MKERGQPVFETTLYRKLPEISARGILLLAGVGLLSLMGCLFAGAAFLAPAGLSGFAGLVAGLVALVRIGRGRAYPREGKIPLVAATFINASLAVFVGVAGYIVLRFGA